VRSIARTLLNVSLPTPRLPVLSSVHVVSEVFVRVAAALLELQLSRLSREHAGGETDECERHKDRDTPVLHDGNSPVS
jgi:hypothetical protein